MRGELVAIIALAGCDWVIPLEEREGVTGSLQTVRTEGSPDGTNIHTPSPLSLTASSFSLVAQVGSEQTVLSLDDDGDFVFLRSPDKPYRVTMTLDGRATDFQHDASEIRHQTRTLGRVDRDPAPPVTLVLPAGGTRVLATTGLWTRRDFLPSPSAMPESIAWRDVPSLSGPLGTLDARRGDRLYFFEYSLVGSYSRISGKVVVDDLVMTDGAIVTLPAFAPATPDRCAHLRATRGSAGRLQQLTNGTAPIQQWSFEVSPIPETLVAHQLLAYAHEANPTNPADVDVKVDYENPIIGATAFVTMSESLVQTLKHPLGLSLDRRVSVTRLAKVADCPNETNLGAGDVGIPYGVAVNGIAIDSEGVAVVLDRTRDTEITWSTDGVADHYVATVFELGRNATNQTFLRTIREVWTVEPRAILDSDTLTRGDFYVVYVVAHLGVPDARKGDFAKRGPLQQTADTFSPSFVIR